MSARWLALCVTGLLWSAVAAQPPGPADSVERVVRAADALIETLGPQPSPIEQMAGIDRRADLLLDFDDGQRENWTYWPTQRAGVPIELLNAAQRRLVQDLLGAVLSSTGHNKVVNIMQLERILKVNDQAGFGRDVGHYTLAFFGRPSVDQPWGWRYEGHHVSLNVSVSPDGVGVTPTFLGSNPGEIRSGPLAGFRVLAAEEDLGRELVGSFTPAQREQALVAAEAPRDILSGNFGKPPEAWDAWRSSLEPAGVAVAELNEVQQHWVRRILDEVVATYRPEVAQAYLDGIDVEALHFAWLGSTARGEPHYYRLQGPDFVFELDNVQNDANHVHSVWRSKSSDFEVPVLERHYRAYRH